MKRLLILSLVFFGCTQEIGNSIYYSSWEESMDVGNGLGSIIFIGNKSNGYTSYDRILVYSDVESYYKKNNKLYVKQKFNDSLFINLCHAVMQLNNTTLPMNLPIEVNGIISETKDSNLVIEKIKNSEYFKRMNNGEFHYYIIDIPKRKIEGVYNLENFKEKIDEKTILSDLEK
ncbi:MAG: hypothetical protein ACR2MS_06880 [Weeksellaceae bacterium]